MNFFGGAQDVSQAEKELRPLLLDEGCQVLSSFELNKIASLTYGDLVCDDIFELIEKIVAHPLEYTPLTLQKTLVVMKHVLIYGSEKCVNSGYGIGRFVETLTTFNTVLAAQQQQGAKSFFQRLQGGGVDRGGPVREAATAVQQLLANINNLQRIRNESASKNSLVPIGNDKVAFITDDVRRLILQKRIEEQARIEIKSNLAKSEGGFGAGYMAKDGKNVVGAAHGIEEMLKMANRGKKKFSDDGETGPSPEDKILQELVEQAKREKEEAASAAQDVDLLSSLDSNSQKQTLSGDLLDFGSPVAPITTPASATGDLLGVFDSNPAAVAGAQEDLLGLAGGNSQTNGGLLDLMAPSATIATSEPSLVQNIDPFASMPNAPSAPPPNGAMHFQTGLASSDLPSAMGTLNLGGSEKQKPSVMMNNEDRFAALDALASMEVQPKPTVLDAKLAENRLLGGESAPPNLYGTSAPLAMTQPNTSGATTTMPSSLPPAPPPSNGALSAPMGLPGPSPILPMVTPGSGQVAAAYGTDENDDDGDNPWVMGGSAGTGLQPIGAAPAAPPPPPP